MRILTPLPFIFLALLGSLTLSCKKPATTQTPTAPECALNTGSYSITIEGNTFDMVLDTNTNFTILYNWFGNQETNFVLYGADQNGNSMSVELFVPGILHLGSTTYSSVALASDFFDIDIDTFSLYVSSVVFNVSKSNLNMQEGMYKPVVATFHGTAHSYPWINGQAPADTLAFSGSFCLNGFVMH